MKFTELKEINAKEAVLTIAQEIRRLNDFVKRLKEQQNYDNALITEIETKILKENARYILYYHVLKIMQEVLTKYSGKSYGEKTREKIANEIAEKTDCRVYLTSNSFDIYPSIGVYGYLFNYRDFSGYTKYNAESREHYKLLINNKIQVLPDDLLYISCMPTYTEDATKKAYNIWCAFKRLKEDYKTFESACTYFNSLLPSGIDNIYPSHFRNYLI